GIFPSKEKPKDEIGEMVLHLQKENFLVKPYERMNLEELKEAEDDFDDNDDRKAFEMYRYSKILLSRLIEWKFKNAPGDVWVIIHLYWSSIPMCLLVNEHLSLLARKFPEVKFLKAIVNSCVQNYHNRYLPTILVYKTGEIKGSFTGVAECGGIHLKVEGMRNILKQFML
uniref:Phosducin like 2 n=1 Tax=Falco tinnunculus TaxID=100819 RepID=A0A8C4XV12_FALTI